MTDYFRKRLARLLSIIPVSEAVKDKVRFYYRRSVFLLSKIFAKRQTNMADLKQNYIRQILAIPELPRSPQYVPYDENKSSFQREPQDAKLIAYYLTQFHPTPYNDLWWGRGVTEWNNVTRAVPQYLGHLQPRLAGELGYYDLRLEQVMQRQIELAREYGIYGFAYYYYWFDGKKLLAGPLENFLKNKQMKMPFMLCWANESWSKRFWGSNSGILIEQPATEKSYQSFIFSVLEYFADERYIKLNGKPVLVIYKPSNIPNCAKVLDYWRQICQQEGGWDIHIVGVREYDHSALNLLALGFDAQTEFQPSSTYAYSKQITGSMPLIQPKFGGRIISYEDLVVNKKYCLDPCKNTYRAIMPMWDNTARRNNEGLIYHGATPELYKRWLIDILNDTYANRTPEDSFVFINAWNEWGEGAYLEPDAFHGYAYLQATKDALLTTRSSH